MSLNTRLLHVCFVASDVRAECTRYRHEGIPQFVELEGSLPCSQQPASSAYPEPDESRPRPLTPVCIIYHVRINIHLAAHRQHSALALGEAVLFIVRIINTLCLQYPQFSYQNGGTYRKYYASRSTAIIIRLHLFCIVPTLCVNELCMIIRLTSP